MRAREFITERKKRSKKTRGLGGYFFPGYGFYGSDAGEGGGDGGGGESKQGMLEAMAADQVLDYVKRTHAPEEFDIEYSITDHPEWELKNIPLSQLNLDPDGEEPDPYNRVNWVDDDKVQELIPQIEAVLKRMPIVVDSQGWIIDGNHRAVAAVEAGLTSVPALVPVKPGVAEGATVTRIDSKPITDFGSSIKAYKHTDDWSQSGVDTGDDSYWKNKNLKTNTTKGLFAGDPKRTALYATGNAHETRYVEFTQNGQPIVYFDRKDLPAMRSRKTYLTVFNAGDFRQLPTGEWFSENPGKPIKQVPIGDPFKYIADQGWIVRVTDDLDKVFKQVKNMHKAGKIAHYGAEGMNESKQGVAEGFYRGDWVRHPDNPWQIGQIQSINNGQAAVTWKKTDKRKKAMSSTHAVDALQHARREFSQLTQPTHTPGMAEDKSNDTAISLSKLGKFHPGADTLAQFVPERTTAQYALHPDKWESTFYSLTNKDSDKLKYYGPKKILIPPGTLVGDMAIANKFYRAKTPEEQEQYAELYKASLQPYPVDVSQYRMPELLIPKQGVAENFADGRNPGRKGLAKRSGVNTKASVSSLRKTAKNSSGEKQRMAHWLANMKAGRAKAKK